MLTQRPTDRRLLNSSSRCAKDALDGLPNHEQTGVATGAGVDGPDGFDLVLSAPRVLHMHDPILYNIPGRGRCGAGVNAEMKHR